MREQLTWSDNVGESPVPVSASPVGRTLKLAAVLIVFGGLTLGLCWLLPIAAPTALSGVNTDLLIVGLAFGAAVAGALTVLITAARTASQGVLLIHVDPQGIHRESRAGSWVMGSQHLPWEQVKWVRVEHDNPRGRIVYGTPMGAMSFGSTIDAETAARLVEHMDAWRRA